MKLKLKEKYAKILKEYEKEWDEFTCLKEVHRLQREGILTKENANEPRFKKILDKAYLEYKKESDNLNKKLEKKYGISFHIIMEMKQFKDNKEIFEEILEVN